ncbi:uncharacterized protein LOC134291674 [Aedes albopictus]|uniref:Uncharacterized protein n=1 Tax=Aedes albopictus TaxID=7160 RepID=A0ABM1ZAZ9_AEDAL
MESVEEELSLLEKKNELWRKQYDERVKIMELRYEQDLAKIDEEFREAVRKMESDFSARKEAVMRQYSGKSDCKVKVIKPNAPCDDTQPQKDCTRVSNPETAQSHEHYSQPMILMKISAVSRNIGIGDRSPQKRGANTKTIPADSSSAHKQEKQNAMPIAARKIRVACRKPHPTMKEQHRHRRRRRRRRRSKQCNRHLLKILLFDPGGYHPRQAYQWVGRIPSVETVDDRLVRLYLPRFASTTVWCCHLKKVHYVRVTLSNSLEFLIKIMQQMNFNCHQFHGGECCE